MGHRGDGRGNFDGDLSAKLATKLDVDQAKVDTALQDLRGAARSDSTNTNPETRVQKAVEKGVIPGR